MNPDRVLNSPLVRPFLKAGPMANMTAVLALAAIVVGVLLTIRTGHWAARLLLIAGALVWPLPEHTFKGPVLIAFNPSHGVHLADLLSIVAVLAAVLLPWRRHRTESTAE